MTSEEKEIYKKEQDNKKKGVGMRKRVWASK